MFHPLSPGYLSPWTLRAFQPTPQESGAGEEERLETSLRELGVSLSPPVNRLRLGS